MKLLTIPPSQWCLRIYVRHCFMACLAPFTEHIVTSLLETGERRDTSTNGQWVNATYRNTRTTSFERTWDFSPTLMTPIRTNSHVCKEAAGTTESLLLNCWWHPQSMTRLWGYPCSHTALLLCFPTCADALLGASTAFRSKVSPWVKKQIWKAMRFTPTIWSSMSEVEFTRRHLVYICKQYLVYKQFSSLLY